MVKWRVSNDNDDEKLLVSRKMTMTMMTKRHLSIITKFLMKRCDQLSRLSLLATQAKFGYFVDFAAAKSLENP